MWPPPAPSPSTRPGTRWDTLFQRPTLPLLHFLDHRIGHVGDQRRRNLDPVHLLQMALNLPRRHPPRIHRDDLVVEARPARLTLGHDLGIERRLAVRAAFPIPTRQTRPSGFFALFPLRVLPRWWPTRSCFSYPRCSVISAPKARSRMALVSCFGRPFSPMISSGLL